MKTLVLGIGNVLMGDEGIGVAIANEFAARYPDLPGTTVVDGGTGGFHLLGYFQEYQRIILLDATIDGEAAGTLKVIRPKYAGDYPATLTAHEIGLKDLIDAAFLLDHRPQVTLVTISIEDLGDVKMALSPAIEAVIPEAVEMILKIIKADR